MTDETGFIDINRFINTSIGRFLDNFQLLSLKHGFSNLGYEKILKEKIEKLDVSVKNYVKGAFLELYTTKNHEKDILFFQGAVHFNKIQTSNELKQFRYVVQPILSSSFNDDYCTIEVSKILINYYQPQKLNLKNIAYMKKISNIMYHWLVSDKDMIKYDEEWFIEFIKNKFTAKDYIESLVFSSGEILVEKHEKILMLIDEHINNKIKIESYHIRFTSENKEELLQHSKLIKMLLKKEIIIEDNGFLLELKSLLLDLKDEGESDEINNLIPELRRYLTEEDYRDLWRNFKEL